MTSSPRPLDATQLGAYFALIEASSLLKHAVEQQLRDAGDLSYVQFQLLATLGDAPAGSRRMTDLADGVVYSRSGLTYQAQTLEKRGLVTRTQSSDDERSITVTITEEGRAVLARVFPGHITVLDDLLYAALSRADIETLAEILGRARDHMRRTPPRSAEPRRRKKSAATDPAP
jgi:DNA-binding MarR family transcriptional regulator